MSEDSDAVPASQTLDRGIRVLEHLAATREPQSIATVAAAVGVHRSIAYRLLRTLEAHRLVERDAEGSYGVGLGVVGLSRSVRRTLQAAATPELARLVRELGMTAFLVVRDGDEAVTVNAVEPRDSPRTWRSAPATGTRSTWARPGWPCSSPSPRRRRPAGAAGRARAGLGVVAGRGHRRHAVGGRAGATSRRLGRRCAGRHLRGPGRGRRPDRPGAGVRRRSRVGGPGLTTVQA
ncbi:helix-turn-helix domain-containing protein [Klenkia terrae]